MWNKHIVNIHDFGETAETRDTRRGGNNPDLHINAKQLIDLPKTASGSASCGITGCAKNPCLV